MRAIVMLLTAVFCCGVVQAQVPHQINYQGYLTNSSGTPVNTTVSMTLKLWDQINSGNVLHTETQSVTVTNGMFNVVIGATATLNAAFNIPYFLGVTVAPDVTEMTPRQPVAASPYALRAAGVDAAAALPAVQITGTVATTQIADAAVTPGKLSAAYAGSASAGGPAGTALALAANGSNCASGQFAAGVDAQGNAEGCAPPAGGTVTSVATGTGLTGGPITGSGTLSADTTYLQRRVSGTCAVGQYISAIAADGTVTCAADANSGGTVTSVATGAGLTGGPINASGTISIPAGGVTAAMLASNSCSSGEILKWNSSAWACAADNAGTVTGTTNFLPLFTAPSTLGNSVIQQAQPTGWSNIAVGFNGVPGAGANTTPVGVDIQGTVSEGSPNGYSATQLVVEGTVASSSFAQAYLRGMTVQPNFNFSAGYGNYAEGAFIPAPNITAGYANVVASLELGQPGPGLSGTSCSAALNISMPNQSGNCPAGGNRVWSIYNGSANNSFFAANVGFGQALPSFPIHTGGGAYVTTGGVWTNASSRDLKKDIRPLPADEAIETLAALLPVTFKYKTDNEAHVGFIAEDVPDLVASKDRKGLSAMDIVAVLAKVVQQQQTALAEQRRELDALKAHLEMERGNR